MKAALTGICRIDTAGMKNAVSSLHSHFKDLRFVHELEQLVIAGVCKLLDDSGISYPVGNDDICLYIGIDDAIEEIKSEYFRAVLDQGLIGASPLLFPFTSPNALTARASIVFDIRGESIVFPVKDLYGNVIKYSVESICRGFTEMAITGAILLKDGLPDPSANYRMDLYFLENERAALKRNARIYRYIDVNNHEGI